MMNLKVFIKKVSRRLFNGNRKKPDFYADNKKKKIKMCYICGEEFENFSRYRINNESDSVAKYFQLVGSDTENFGCYYCNCNDRDRHLFMFFDKLSFWDKFMNARVIHFAPEHPLSTKIEKLLPTEYIKCDLCPREDWRKIDVTKIEFEDSYFDILICNHVLEHVTDLISAMKEIRRVLKKDGVAILQTPLVRIIVQSF